MIRKEINYKSKKFMISVIITIALLSIGFIYFYKSVNAANTSNFDAGNIISDSVFYNSSSMSVSDIQAFLNSKVTNCDTNHAGFTGSGGTIYNPPWVCLKDFYENPDSTYTINYTYTDTNGSTQTGSRVYYYNNAYTYTALGPVYKNGDYKQGIDHLVATIQGGGSIPTGAISAAQIIYNVAQEYGINPQVLIVLLQKEQGLVTDTWPSSWQYQAATGYGCPDYSPCSVNYAGFSKQLASAAWQFKRYQSNPSAYSYVAGRNNTILWSPATNCGSSTVYIQSQATAGLYNYTPYRPNQAALNAGYGTGDGCSAYGNRNFWLYFTDWFGDTTATAAYRYSITSREFYSDSTYNTAASEPLTIEPGQKKYAKITIKNTGNQTWYGNNLRLGTLNPRDRGSVFASDDWLCAGRPAVMSNSSTAPGETTTFTFELKAPSDLGSYQESFGVLIEGNQWLDGIFTIPINVESASPYYSIKTLSFDAYSDASMTNKLDTSNITRYTNSKIYIKTIIKNTGNQILPANLTMLSASNPIDRTSPYSDSSWLDGSSRAAKAQEGDILPQGTGTFTFSMTTPSTSQARTQEQFGILIEHTRWLNYNIGSISIQTDQRPSSFLGTTLMLNTGESLLSNNEKYRLILQGDGNLVIYNEQWKALWASWTVGRGGVRLVIQADGNLVLYDKNWVAVWNSGTPGKGVSSLNMQDDGNLVIYNSKGYTWASWTANR